MSGMHRGDIIMPGVSRVKVVNGLSNFKYIKKDPKYFVICKDMLETKLQINLLKRELRKHISGKDSNVSVPNIEKLLIKYETIYSGLLSTLEKADNKAKSLKMSLKKAEMLSKKNNKKKVPSTNVDTDALNGSKGFYETYVK